MYYKFLKNDVIDYLRRDLITDSYIQNIVGDDKDSFLINSNYEPILDFLNFFDSEDNLHILNGFLGSGKTALIDFVKGFFDENVLCFRFNCFESTTLDDILLSLFTDFIDYHNKKKIFLPKVDSPVFSDKINAFIKACELPVVIVIDSFDKLNISEKTLKDIINFINHLGNFDKIKLVISARVFDEDIVSKDFKISNSITKNLSSDDFKSLFELNNYKANFFKVEELYKNTRGHYLYASIILNLLSTLHITIETLLDEFSKKDMEFYEFLTFKILSFIPDNFLRGLYFMALIRQGVSEEFLINNKFFSKEDIVYLKDRMILTRESCLFYLKDYIKEGLEESLDLMTKVKIHKYLMELYDSQLPKKPSARDLLISRSTMRHEIEYHKHIVESSNLQGQPAHGLTGNVDFNYLSYSKTVGHDWVPPEKIELEVKNIPDFKIKQPKSKLMELSKEEVALLNSSKSENAEELFADNENLLKNALNVPSDIAIEDEIIPQEETLASFIKDAQMYEKEFDFESAVFNYKKALSCKSDALFEAKKPLLLTKMAICYKKLQNPDLAVRYFEDVYKLYREKEPVKANYVLLSIAQIYNETYKHSLAKDIYEKILSSSAENPPNLLIRTYLDMSEIEDSNSNVQKAIEYCKKALEELDKSDDNKSAGEVYFKYALLLDDLGKIEEAVSLYQKCIDVSEGTMITSFTSSSYSNLASIHWERNNLSASTMYYEKAIEADKQLDNYEGLYFSYSKLAQINKTRNSSLALEYLVKAMGAARRLKDNFYLASAYLDLGDFYYNKKIDDKALKAYLSAKKLVSKQSNDDNIQKVNTRISDLKARIGSSKFSQLVNEFKRK